MLHFDLDGRGSDMPLSSFFNRLAIWAIAGAVLGLVVGLILLALDVVENPFWSVSIGIMVAAVALPVREQLRAARSTHDDPDPA